MEAWIGSVITIVSVLIGGLMTWFITQQQLRHQEAQQRKQLILSRLEELHRLLSEFSMVCSNVVKDAAFNYGLKVAEEITAVSKTYKEIVSNNGNFSLERIYMLIGFYAPELKEYEIKLSDANKLYSEMIAKASLAIPSQAKEQLDSLGELSKSCAKINQVCSEIRAEVIALSKKYL